MNQVLTILSIFCLLLAVFFWFKSRTALSFWIVFLAGAFIAFHAIFQDNYLHPWDERYHAVVALNAMQDPFHLKLMPERLIDWWPYEAWYANYTWLHKQPLFTWQMALE